MEERTIDLKQLFWTVLRRWRLILVLTLLCGVAAAVYPYLRAGQAPADTSKAQEKYDEEMAEYNTLVAYYEALIADDQAYLDFREEYESNSLLYQIDAMNEPYTAAEVVIKREGVGLYQLTEDLTLQDPELAHILQFYRLRLSQEDYLSAPAVQFGTKDAYLRELISFSVSQASQHLTLSARGTTREMAVSLMDSMIKEVHNAYKDAVAEFGDHELQIRNRYFRNRLDQDLQTNKRDAVAARNAVVARIANNQAAIKKLEKPEKPAALTATAATPSRRTMAKYALAGLAGGFLLSMILIGVLELLGKRVMSAGELNRRYGLRALTVLPPAAGKKRNGLDQWLSRRGEDRVYTRLPEEERYAMACANLSVYAADAADIVLVGEVGATVLDTLASRLKEQCPEKAFHTAACINENAASLETLRKYDSVVLAEQIHASRYPEIDREVQVLRDWNKEIAGTIVLEQ